MLRTFLRDELWWRFEPVFTGTIIQHSPRHAVGESAYRNFWPFAGRHRGVADVS